MKGISQTENPSEGKEKRVYYSKPGSIRSPPPVPNVIQTFTGLQGFSQLYDNKLEVDHKIDPDLPLSQPEAKQHHNNVNMKAAENGGMMMLDIGLPSGKEGKMATKEMFGKRATFQNCSFVFHMWNERTNNEKL